MPQVDYDALAKKFGGVDASPAAVDYDALALEFGGKDAESPKPKGVVQSFVDRGVETVQGLGSLALEAGKSALTLEGQAKFLPRMAANMYEGAVQAGADAITRQQTPLRKAVAAVPVVGPYVMNAASDIEEGKGSEVLGRTAFDALTLAVPGSPGGRAALEAGASGAVRGAGGAAKAGAGVAKAVGPEVAAGVAGEVLLGGLGGGVAGATVGHLLRPKVAAWLKERFGMSAAKAEATAGKMSEKALADLAERESILAEKQIAAVENKVIKREIADAKKMAKIDSKIRPIPPNKLPPVLPDPVVPEIAPAVEVITEAPKVRKPRAAKAKPEPAPEPAPAASSPPEVATVRPGAPGDNARAWMQKYAEADIEGRRALVKGLSGKISYDEIRQLGAYTDDITTDGPLSTPKPVESHFKPAKLQDVEAPAADESAARAARQKQHIEDSYRAKAEKDAKNVAAEDSLLFDLERSIDHLKKRGPEKPAPNPAQSIAEKVKERVLSMKGQGMSRGQMKNSVLEDILRRKDGYKPADVQRAVDLILKETN